MAVERWVLNPVDEPTGDATVPSPLELAAWDESTGIHIAGIEYPSMPSEIIKAQSISTEGARRAARKLDTKTLKLKLLLVEPEGATSADTNLVRDPGGSGDASRWIGDDLWRNGLLHTASAGSQITQVTDHATAYMGDRYVKVITAGAAATDGVEGLVENDPTTGVFASGVAYRFDVYLRGEAGGETLALKLGTTGDIATANITLTNAWARYSVSWTPGANRTNVLFGIVGQSAAAKTFYVDSAMVRRGTSATSYYDGDFPGCEWVGGPRSSRSNRIASGARRYRMAGDLEQAVEYVSSRGQGTLRRNTPGKQQVTYDLIDANLVWDSQQFIDCGVAQATIDFTCQPFGRGREVAATEVTNLFPNPSAETDATLVSASNATHTRTTGHNAVGAAAFQMSSSGAGDMNLFNSTAITATPGLRYNASAWFKTAVTARNCRVRISWYLGATLVSSVDGTSVADATTGWALASVSAIAPSTGVDRMFVSCYVLATGGAAEIHYIDGIMLNQGDSLASYFDGSFPNAHWTGVANLSSSVRLGTVVNLVTNPSFEPPHADPTTGWVETDADASMTVTSDPVVARGPVSRRSVKLVNTAAGAGDDDYIALTIAAAHVKPNTTYVASAWVRCEGFVAGALTNRGLSLFTDATGNSDSSTLSASTQGWVRHTATLPTGSDPTTLSIRLYGPQATTYWDDVMLVEGSTTPDYFDGDYPGYSWCGLPHQSEAMGPNAVVQKNMPVAILSADIKGNADAIGKLTLRDAQNVDQGWAIWGATQQRNPPVATNDFIYGAESLTVLGGSSLVTVAVGTHSSRPVANNAVRNTDLTTTPVAILSGQVQLLEGGSYFSHTGLYRAFVRVYCPIGNTGTVRVALEWSEGDFRKITRNEFVTFDPSWTDSYRLLDLGYVQLEKTDTGVQRWEPRLIATSTTVGDEIDIDWMGFIPVDVASGEANIFNSVPAPTSFLARDEFNTHAAGVLAGKVMPVGGTWTGIGDATDFNTVGTTHVTRTANSDTDKRINYGANNHAAVAVRCEVGFQQGVGLLGGAVFGIAARVVDLTNSISLVYVDTGPGERELRVVKLVGGASKTLGAVNAPFADSSAVSQRLTLVVFDNGIWQAYADPITSSGNTLIFSGRDIDLAAGGLLATGRVGLYDQVGTYSSSAPIRYYDNFAAWTPPADAAVFAAKILAIHSDKASRADSTGTLSVKPSRYEGSYLRLPPNRKGNLITHLVAKTARDVSGDSHTDDLALKLDHTPRYLITPDGA